MAGYRRTKVTVTSDSGEESVIVGEEGVKVPSGDTKLTVGEVEKLTGTSKETLRFYDKKGLLCPERTGENTSNNRKLYDVDDLGRLQVIQTLRAYNFSLEEIKRILDDDNVDIYDVMAAKLEELKRQEARLRALILFVEFVDLADDDLIEGLANGPADIEILADLARENASYKKALQKLDAYSEEEAAKSLDALYDIAGELLLLDEIKGFRGVEKSIVEFFAWWDGFAVPIESVGYLGFWAIFEDHGLIAEYIESKFQSGDSGVVQMCTFFVLMVHLAEMNNSLIVEIAKLANSDIVLSIEKTQELIAAISCALLGAEGAMSTSSDNLTNMVGAVLMYIYRALENSELCEYLGLASIVSFDEEDLEKTLQIIAVIGDEG